ncbi:MAG TPA: DUF1844 domain-containing protein [Phycisphaerae bacterium]|nr:DUF1844 domain-containing protein [Phycisphaerae bacterium]
MAEEEKKIIVDEDWKAEAKREKERLAEETAKREPLPGPNFAELLNLIAMQAMVGLGLVSGPGGERIPPNFEIAKHFVDLLQVLEDKTKNNLTPEEKKLLDQVLYEMRMRYVQAAGGAPPPKP